MFGFIESLPLSLLFFSPPSISLNGISSNMSSLTFSFPRCVCIDKETQTLRTFNNTLKCYKWSIFLISPTYFSIPLKLFYLVTCSSIFPFRCIFLQFSAFIVICGLTRFPNIFTYTPHLFFLCSLSHNPSPIHCYGATPATNKEKSRIYLGSADREQPPQNG